MFHPPGDVGTRDVSKGFGDGINQCLPGTCTFGSQYRLGLRPCQFDRIEVVRIRRQVDDANSRLFCSLLDGHSFVRRQVVHHDNVAGLELFEQRVDKVLLEDIEGQASTEHQGGDDTLQPDRGDQSDAVAPVFGRMPHHATA